MKKIGAFMLLVTAVIVMLVGWAFWIEAFEGTDDPDAVPDQRVIQYDGSIERVDPAPVAAPAADTD